MPAFKPLNQQTIVVTGASSGIGLCTALHAAQQGARVVLVARSADVLETTAARIQSEGGQALAVVADVSDREQMELAARASIAQFGHIDTWVNNAGVAIYGRLDEVDEEDSRRLFDINFWGVVNGSLVALPYLKGSHGTLINIGSEVSEAVIPLQGMYSASKHAVKGFTDALRIEVEEMEGADLCITLVLPTAVDTPYPEHARNYMAEEPRLPAPMIDPEKVAQAILEVAVKGGRDVHVGAMSTLNTAIAKLMPSVGDKLSAQQADRQQRDLPPQDPQGTLYQPGHSGRIHGPGDRPH